MRRVTRADRRAGEATTLARPGLAEGFADSGVASFLDAMKAMDLPAGEETRRIVRAWFEFYATWPGRRVIGFTDAAQTAVKLVADSFALGLLPGGLSDPGDAGVRQAIDLGSGNGWPGLAVRLMLEAAGVTFLDSRTGACDFMRRFVESAGVRGISIAEARAEEAASGANMKGRFDLAVTRAMASPGVSAELASGFVGEGGRIVLWLGPEQEDAVLARPSVPELGLALDATVKYELPGAMGRRTLASFRRVGRPLAGYPRRLSSIRAKPLL